jgi:hypothetical protein
MFSLSCRNVFSRIGKKIAIADWQFAIFDSVMLEMLGDKSHDEFGSSIANNPQPSWGFEGEPPEAVMKHLGILVREIGLHEDSSFSCV